MPVPEITLSVVSHRQNALVNQLLEDVQRVCVDRVALVLTENVPDPLLLAASALTCPVEMVVNSARKGFGANHNAAFRRSDTPYFCVCNPDVRLRSDPFPRLLEVISDQEVGVVGPLVRNPQGAIEDSARRFPSTAILLGKLFGASSGPDYPTDRGPIAVDWVAGMFMLFRSEHYRAVNGFDEGYFLYYEDIDICHRLGRVGRKVMYQPRAEIVHDARRASRRNPILMQHHVRSAARFFLRRR